jgi:hypothetical protein
VSKLLNTRFWLLATGTLFTVFPTFSALSGETVSGAAAYWPETTLTEKEAEIAAVVELAWNFHILAIGLVVLAIALLTNSEQVRARLGAVAMLAFVLSQGLSAGTAAQFGYAGADAMPLIVTVLVGGIPLITLIACIAARWTTKTVKYD